MGTCGRQFPRVARFISILLFPVVTLLANSAQPQQRQKRENNQNKISERAAHLVTGFFTAFAPQKMSNMIEWQCDSRFVNGDRYHFDFVGKFVAYSTLLTMQDGWILAQVLFCALRWAHLTRTGRIIGHRPISPSHVANLAGLSVSACGLSHIIKLQ